ncbi:MAG: hypothetical protein IT288_06795 [Bdellovibrionales bacterium]|nr:hypothetical protein [Bdellovibrionales bacterium]
MIRSLGIIVALLILLLAIPAHAVKVKDQVVRRKAFFTPENGTGLYTPLDLKSKRYTFTPTDHEICGRALVRDQENLAYSCTLELPVRSSLGRLREHESDREISVNFGGVLKKVQVRVSADGRYVTFSTRFDQTGLDFDTAEFNEEFFQIYAKTAQLVIGEAMNNQPLRIKVLEN